MFRTVSISFAVLILTLAAIPASACYCKGKNTIKNSVKLADLVATGKVLSTQYVTLTDSTTKNPVLRTRVIMRYEMLVEKTYKGKTTSDTITLYSGTGSSDCGMSMNKGGRYIIYATAKSYMRLLNKNIRYPEGERIYWTHSCTRTVSFNQQEEDDIKAYLRK